MSVVRAQSVSSAAKTTQNSSFQNTSFAHSTPLSRLSARTDLHLARKSWHMANGLAIAGVYYYSGISQSQAILILSFFFGWSVVMETLRLRSPSVNAKVMKHLGLIMRKCEVNRVSGIPYYTAAALLAVVLFPKPVAALSILYLGCGDPIASLIGIMYGDRSVRFANGKSLIGTLAGIATCFLVSLVFLGASADALSLSLMQIFALSSVGGLAGGLAEWVPVEVDDNLSIPLVSGLALWMGWMLFV